MRYTGKFINNEGKEVSCWFDAPNEDALKEYLGKKGWKAISYQQEEPLKGIGGWLGIYVWLGLISAPFFIIFDIAIILNPSFIQSPEAQSILSMSLVERIISYILVILNFLSCLFLLQLKPWSVTFVKRMLIVTYIMTIYNTFSHLAMMNIMNVLLALCLPLVWYSYFVKSKRVQKTFTGERGWF